MKIIRKTKAKRKLLAKHVLAKAIEQQNLGVPIARILHNLELDISRPTISSLIAYAKKSEPTILASIYPPWLDQNSDTIQQQPEKWIYVGFFPHGEWQYNENA